MKLDELRMPPGAPARGEPSAPPPPPPPLSDARGRREVRLKHSDAENLADELNSFLRDAPRDRNLGHDEYDGSERGGLVLAFSMGLPWDPYLADQLRNAPPEVRDRVIRASFLNMHELLAQDETEQAIELLNDILFIDPGNALARPLVEGLKSGSLDDEAYIAALQELEAIAAAEAARREAFRRELELRRRLDARLLEMIAAQQEPREVLVTVLLNDLDDATLEAVREAGLTIESAVERATFIIGRVRSDRLETLAMLEPVRRVELVP